MPHLSGECPVIEFCITTAEDAALIVRTRQKAWDATYRGIYPDEEIDSFDFQRHIQMEIRRQNDPDYHSYTVMDGEVCVGYFAFGPVGDMRFRLHSLYLLPRAQKQGLGHQIFRFVQEACLSMGYDSIHLDCHPKNQNALSFYQHMGGIVANIDAGHDNPQEDSCTITFKFA